MDLLLSLIDVKWLLGGLAALVFGVITMFKGRIDGAAKERAKNQKEKLDALQEHYDDLGRAARAGRDGLPDIETDLRNRDTKR